MGEEAPLSAAPEVRQPAPMAMKVEEPGQMNAAVGEIKKINESLSQLRQENIALKEETLRLKRIAAASEKPTDSPSYSSTTVSAVRGSCLCSSVKSAIFSKLFTPFTPITDVIINSLYILIVYCTE